MSDRLKREGNPPIGILASPVPQAWDTALGDYQKITGQNLGGGRFASDCLGWGKTAGGLYLPIRVDDQGRPEVQLSGRNIDIVQTQYDQTLNVASGNSTSITIEPPAGELWRLKVLHLSIPAITGSTGTHRVIVGNKLTGHRGGFLDFTHSSNAATGITENYLIDGAQSQTPKDGAGVQIAILNAVVTATSPLVITYFNNSDLAQTGQMQLTITREVEEIA